MVAKTSAVAVRSEPLDYPAMVQLAELVWKSGVFPDVKTAGHAVIKMMAGSELATMLMVFVLLVAGADAVSSMLRRRLS